MLLPALLMAAALAQQPPVPKPFPGAPAPQRPAQPAPPEPARPAAAPPATPAAPPRAEQPAADLNLGVALYPGAQFLTSYDAGRGQRYYIFGTSASFVQIVEYYRVLLKQRGDVVSDAPATHIFEIGRFRDETMAFPPSVTIKDYVSEVSQGYPNPKPGGQPARFPTIIQIVPAPTGER
jgi:hypothetical protein